MSAPSFRLVSDGTTTKDSPQDRIPCQASQRPQASFCQPNSVAVCVGDVIPLLLDAALSNRAWLEDFAGEAMEIPQDLYEVLLSYRKIAMENRRAA